MGWERGTTRGLGWKWRGPRLPTCACSLLLYPPIRTACLLRLVWGDRRAEATGCRPIAHPSTPSHPVRGIGDLVLVYKRVTGLAGHTSRVRWVMVDSLVGRRWGRVAAH